MREGDGVRHVYSFVVNNEHHSVFDRRSEITAHLFSMEFKYEVMSIQSTQLPAALILVPHLFLIVMITFSIISCYIVHHVA